MSWQLEPLLTCNAAYTLGRVSAPLTFSRRAGSVEHLLFGLSIYLYTAKRSRYARHMFRKEVASVVLLRNFYSSL